MPVRSRMALRRGSDAGSGGFGEAEIVARESGAQRTDRLVGWLMAIGGAVLFFGKTIPELSRVHDYPMWWNALGAIVAGTILLFAVAGWLLPFVVLRAGWLFVPTLGAFLLATSFLGYTGPDPDLAVPWPWTLEAVGVSYLVLWLRPWMVVVAVFVSGSLPALSGVVFLGFVPDMVATLTPVRFTHLGFIAIFLGIRAQLNRFRQSQDEAMAQREQQARAIEETARQERLSRLIHDDILSVLTASLALSGSPPATLRHAASHAFDLASRPPERAPQRPDECRDADQVVTEMIGRLRGLDPACRIRADAVEGSLPVSVIDAVLAASAEALRNSLRHAGAGADRTVMVAAAHDALTVVVADTGRGFDLEGVPPGRLGVRESVVGRMRGIGGDATIRTAVGAGTEVTLAWPKS